MRSASVTFVGHAGARLEEQLLPDGAAVAVVRVVAQPGAAAPAAVQAQAPLEGVLVPAHVGHALPVAVQDGVDQQVHRALVGALHRLLEP